MDSNLPPVAASTSLEKPSQFLQSNHLVVKRKLLKLVGAAFHIHEAATMVEVAVANQKGFKLKEDIRILVGGTETIGIFARQIIDFSASYDIVDLTVTPNTRIGVLKRKGLASTFIRDEWIVMDGNEVVIGKLIEDSVLLGLVRRFLASIVPQNYDLFLGDEKVVDYKQNFNPFTYHLNVFFLVPPAKFDRRFAIASAVLVAAIEGRQKGG